MGCLTVQAKQRNTTPRCRALLVNSGVQVGADNRNTPVVVNFECKNARKLASATNVNTPVTATAKCKNVKASVGAALVCKVSVDQYELVYVTQGPRIGTNGYFMVKRKKG